MSRSGANPDETFRTLFQCEVGAAEALFVLHRSISVHEKVHKQQTRVA